MAEPQKVPAQRPEGERPSADVTDPFADLFRPDAAIPEIKLPPAPELTHEQQLSRALREISRQYLLRQEELIDQASEKFGRDSLRTLAAERWPELCPKPDSLLDRVQVIEGPNGESFVVTAPEPKQPDTPPALKRLFKEEAKATDGPSDKTREDAAAFFTDFELTMDIQEEVERFAGRSYSGGRGAAEAIKDLEYLQRDLRRARESSTASGDEGRAAWAGTLADDLSAGIEKLRGLK